LRFRHPLLRSALRQQAAPADRRRVDAALAEVLSASPQRRLWHRASAAPGPDEALARELTEVAIAAAPRQAPLALAALTRAVQLSGDPAARGHRQVSSCLVAHEQGDPHTVRRLLGEIDEHALRRAHRVTESRPPLRAAVATFDALGVTPWADRARSELRATGETRRRPTDALTTLTPQEQQIARLAAEGLSNREIGAHLFLSPRTVSTHLYRIYPKVHGKSRAELARVITSSDVR
ncbi:LuxR C-terminal-related transcriptional regulator, partial [Micromonospora sp. DH15]|nr:LuxR C-terminal-related transcriptional regulator [Micromonospora sp. DH15]